MTRWILNRGLAPPSFDATTMLDDSKDDAVDCYGIAILPSGQSLNMTRRPWLLLSVDPIDQSLSVSWHQMADAPTVTMVQLDPGLYLVRALSIGLSLVAAIRPWHKPLLLSELQAVSGDFLLLSAIGWYGGAWCDGPLARIHHGGGVSNYLPAGGPAALVVQTGLDMSPPKTEAWAAVQELEGSEGERIKRCLLGQMQDTIGRLPLPGALGLRCRLRDLTPATAAELVLARQAAANRPFEVSIDPELGAPSPAWRRLCQNLGIRITTGATQPPALILPGVAPMAHDAQLEPLIAALNAITPLIPPSLHQLEKS
ncbi:MAG: hypothetical protein NTZ90_12950 [Proteobacteria bacterium]|nr:hypothetical protein [Pseudomonadota bacterium]